MSQRIEFKLSENAKSVSEHLYNVQLEGNCLVFSEFDEEAFKLAVALEGFDESAYKVVQNLQAARTFGEAIRPPARFYAPPKYIVEIQLVRFLPSFALLAISSPRVFVHSDNSKHLSIDIAINEAFGMFLSVLLTEISNGISITLSGRMDKVVFTAKNIGTRYVQHFLGISCDGELQTVQLYPVNNVTIKRVSFENY